MSWCYFRTVHGLQVEKRVVGGLRAAFSSCEGGHVDDGPKIAAMVILFSLLQKLLQKEKRRLVGRSPAYLLHGADCTVPTDVRVICEGLVQSVETLTHLVPDQPLLVRSHTRPAVDSKRDY